MKDQSERIRAMLDERAVEYTKRDGMKATSITHITHWCVDGVDAEYTEQFGGGTRLSATGLAPEQAIAATLGGGELTAEQVRKVIEGHVTFYEGGDYDEQAIADELNAALGNGTCEFKPFQGEDASEPNAMRGVCSECSALMYGKDNFCPNCGAKVVSE